MVPAGTSSQYMFSRLQIPEAAVMRTAGASSCSPLLSSSNCLCSSSSLSCMDSWQTSAVQCCSFRGALGLQIGLGCAEAKAPQDQVTHTAKALHTSQHAVTGLLMACKPHNSSRAERGHTHCKVLVSMLNILMHCQYQYAELERYH